MRYYDLDVSVDIFIDGYFVSPSDYTEKLKLKEEDFCELEEILEGIKSKYIDFIIYLKE